MVKKKSKSKRITLKDKYKIQKRTAETHRKRKKEARRDAAKGVIRCSGKGGSKKNKDPGIPNSWPFKQDLLKDIQRTKERMQERQQEQRMKSKMGLKELRLHQYDGGTARTVEELIQQAQRDQNTYFDEKQNISSNDTDNHGNIENDENMMKDVSTAARLSKDTNRDSVEVRSDGTVAAGQASRRAYLRELKKVVDGSDILLQVLDVRDPIGSRIHPSVENAILSHASKRMVLVLNKIDLVPKTVVSEWLTYLRRSHPTIAVKASTQMTTTGASGSDRVVSSNTLPTQSNVPVGMDGLLQLLKNYARTGGTGGKSKTTIVVGIIGYPNVGKSSIINALKRSRAVGVSPKPGFTTCMQEVVLDKNVRLLDSPGVVFNDSSSMLSNCIDSESMQDPIPAVSAILDRCDHASLLMTYNIPSFPVGDTMAFLALVAKSYGRVLKGGIPDKVSAARAVLKDWNHGKIPFFTQPPKTDDKSIKSNDAVVVGTFAEEFDVFSSSYSYDDAVMNTLPDHDELDFVQVRTTSGKSKIKENGKGNDHMTQEVVQYLSASHSDAGDGNDTDMDNDESDEESDDSDQDNDAGHAAGPSKLSSRARLAEADDYDFDLM